MSYCTASCNSDFYHNAGNKLFYVNGPNKLRPTISGKDTILKWLTNQPEFSNFLSLVYIAEMYEEFDNISNDYTLFAPTNDALNKHPELLANLTKGKARTIVCSHLTKNIPLCLSNISNHLYEVQNPLSKTITVDGRRKPFKVGYNSIGSAFGLEFETIANMASEVEFITKNGVIHPIDDCLHPMYEIYG